MTRAANTATRTANTPTPSANTTGSFDDDRVAPAIRGFRSRLDTMSKIATARRLQVALEMYQFAEDMQRARLRRQRPDASEQEIEASLRAWRCSRPGAPHGDAAGRPSGRFE